ncbi:MAG TPA: cytochrome b/b6 domain-containing protein [Gammaproteobacteria bacterium]|nr:cytochrome b/b6 domain-containing protein [Gammaproteobacteria bacterium]
MSAAAVEGVREAARGVLRHALADRVFHWVTAAAVLTLLATAFLPIVGLRFSWLTIHWAAGWVLIAALGFHIVRAVLTQDLGRMWIGRTDFRELAAVTRWSLRRTVQEPPKPGKYSFAQKLVHGLFALALLASSVTGALMMVKIDTPWWRRNPYWLADSSWGVIYVFHDLAALSLVTLVIVHVYFALRPEKLLFLRAMIRGRITREEFAEHHDSARWQADER